MKPRLHPPVLAAWLLALVLASAARAEDKVWVINSDRSVERYRVTEDAFRATWRGDTVDIDLGRLSLDRSEVDRRVATAPPAAIYCIGSKAYLTASQLLEKEPMVLSSAINWQRFPERDDRTVIAHEVPSGAQLTLFHDFFPRVRKIGVLCSRKYNEQWILDAVAKGKEAEVEIIPSYVEKPSEIEGTLDGLLPKVDAVWLIADPAVLVRADGVRGILRAADAARKPVFTYSRAFVEMGAVLAISPDPATIGRQAAVLVETRLRNGRLMESVSNPAGSDITLNLKVVREYGLELNEEALHAVSHIVR